MPPSETMSDVDVKFIFSQLLCLYLLLYKYFLMTLQPKFDLNVHVTHRESAERTPWPKKIIEVENKFHAKQRGFPVSTDTDLHTKFEWRNGSTKARSEAYTEQNKAGQGIIIPRVVATITDGSLSVFYAFFTCQIARQSIDVYVRLHRLQLAGNCVMFNLKIHISSRP